jgi:hypothetical protein
MTMEQVEALQGRTLKKLAIEDMPNKDVPLQELERRYLHVFGEIPTGDVWDGLDYKSQFTIRHGWKFKTKGKTELFRMSWEISAGKVLDWAEACLIDNGWTIYKIDKDKFHNSTYLEIRAFRRIKETDGEIK